MRVQINDMVREFDPEIDKVLARYWSKPNEYIMGEIQTILMKMLNSAIEEYTPYQSSKLTYEEKRQMINQITIPTLKEVNQLKHKELPK